jgi:sugar lactone lactonase YvrE
MERRTKPLVSGLGFPEGPRWRDGRLWFSDMSARTVSTVDASGRQEHGLDMPNRPSGLGWRPDGTLLVVSMEDRRLLAAPGAGSAGAALEEVGNIGFDLAHWQEELRPTVLVVVDPGGGVAVAADDLLCPNGMVLTPDDRTLIVAETFGARLTAFDVAGDGSLSNRRPFGVGEGVFPDGICLDAEGAIWAASPLTGEVVRVREGGEITDRIKTSAPAALACMLGGPDGRTLFVCTCTKTDFVEADEAREGSIEVVAVDVPRAGRP